MVAQCVPFNTTEKRSFSELAESKNPKIGPGSYIDVNNPIYSSVSKNLLKYAVDRGIMMSHGLELKPFGIGDKRFERSYFLPKDGPGPAYYEQTMAEGMMQLNLNNIGFLTTTERFSDKRNNMTKGKIMRSSLMMEEKINNLKNNKTSNYFYTQNLPKQTRSPYYNIFHGNRIAFDSTQPRFNDAREMTMKNPGPGQYSINYVKELMRHGRRKAFNITEKKFKNSYLDISSTDNSVGPGSYSTDLRKIKKSFNINTYLT